ncbi:alginate export family protein [Psychroserpens sp. S379A]|uniref:alginate export family protein n=1 Tax=Psychroserpens sp. S379A TaxID=3415137 RepID=UPI003C798B61
MKSKLLFFIGSLIFNIVLAQDEVLNFSLLRQNDKIIYSENLPNQFYYKLKQINLNNSTTVSLGGSWRFQAESFINEQFQNTAQQDNLWFLNRLMLHAHLKIDQKFEAFAELNSSLPANKDALIPVDKDALSLNQFFLRYHFNSNWNILIGRQNMRLGSGRLVDIREGPNVRLSFDMAQLQYQDHNTNLLGFYAIPVQQQEGVFDNDYLKNNESLSALYWTQQWTKNTNTDLYVLYKTEKNKTWNSGTANDNRASIGLRHFGNWNSFKYNNEFVYQFGNFGNQNINAWTMSYNVEKDFSIGTFGLKTEAISGNDEGSSSLNTFDGLYPRGAYFGRVARIGPSNLIDIHPYYNKKIGNFNLELDYVAFWRFSTTDGVYGAPLILDYPSVNTERFIGNQIGSILTYELNNNISLELESNIIFPGAFLRKSHLNNTLYHFVFTTEIKF